jgi:hypothetical protein
MRSAVVTVKIGGRRTVAAVGLERVVRTNTQGSRGVGLSSGLEVGHSDVANDDGVCVEFGHGSGDDKRRGGEESEDGELHRWSLMRMNIRTCR